MLRFAAFLILSFCAIAPAPAVAGTGDLSEDTIFVFSIDDATALRQGFRQSDWSAFLQDPQVVPIAERVMSGASELLEFLQSAALESIAGELTAASGAGSVPGGTPRGAGGDGEDATGAAGGKGGAGGAAPTGGAVGTPEEASGPSAEAFSARQALARDVFSTIREYSSTLYREVTGRFAVSVGTRALPDGRNAIDLLVHFQGGEQFQKHHDRIFELIAKSGGQFRIERFEIGGVPFQAALAPPEEVPGPVAPPDGLLIGHKGSDYYIGLNRTGLLDYITTTTARTGVATGRLAGDPAYQKAVASAGAGQMILFLNAKPIWKLVRTYVPRGGGAPFDIAGILEDLGIFSIHNFYCSMSFLPEGQEGGLFVACGEEKGILTLLPAADVDVAMPPYVPRFSPNASVSNFRLSGIYNLTLDLIQKYGGPQAHQQAQMELANVGAELGVTIQNLVENLEGTILMCETTRAASGIDLMNPAGAFATTLFGLRVKDRVPFENLLAGLLKHPEIGASVATAEHAGIKLYKFDPLGSSGMPEEYSSGQPVLSIAIHDDWMLCGMSEKTLKFALDVATTKSADQLALDPKFVEQMKHYAAPSAMVSYCDVAATYERMSDIARLGLGFAPMFLAGAYAVPGVPKLLSSENVPPNAVYKKYFGQCTAAARRADGGFLYKTFAPRVTRAAAPAPDAKGAGK
ncbi:MAG: hypothetical protein L0Z55_02150 [Planctomycetes bacterium]|nr:hypothetical protein [Planctomycetota bacterium]